MLNASISQQIYFLKPVTSLKQSTFLYFELNLARHRIFKAEKEPSFMRSAYAYLGLSTKKDQLFKNKIDIQ